MPFFLRKIFHTTAKPGGFLIKILFFSGTYAQDLRVHKVLRLFKNGVPNTLEMFKPLANTRGPVFPNESLEQVCWF